MCSMRAAGVTLCRTARTSPGSALVLKLPQERGLHTTGLLRRIVQGGPGPSQMPRQLASSVTACHAPADTIV